MNAAGAPYGVRWLFGSIAPDEPLVEECRLDKSSTAYCTPKRFIWCNSPHLRPFVWRWLFAESIRQAQTYPPITHLSTLFLRLFAQALEQVSVLAYRFTVKAAEQYAQARTSLSTPLALRSAALQAFEQKRPF